MPLLNFSPVLSPKADFTSITDTLAIMQDLISLLNIQQDTYPFNPSVGTNLTKYVFEPNDSLTYTMITNDIKLALNTLSNNLSLGSLSLSKTSDGKALIVSINVIINSSYSQNISLLVTASNIINMSYINV